jgi:hypothetical protein
LEDLVAHLGKEAGLDLQYEASWIGYTYPETKKKYKPDFQVGKSNVYIESKGRFTSQDRKKMLLLVQQHPDKVFIMLFGRPENTLTKISKTTYSEWCEKHGIRWMDIDDFKKDPKACLSHTMKTKVGFSSAQQLQKLHTSKNSRKLRSSKN